MGKTIDKIIVPAIFDADGVQVSSEIRSDGKEYPDPVPMRPPVGFSPEPSISDLIKMFVRRELSAFADQNDFDSFEEAEDFDIEDDPVDPLTPYEKVFDPPKPLIPDVKPDTPLDKTIDEPAVASPPADKVEVPLGAQSST